LFRMNVGEAVERVKSKGERKVRVFGEMVDLLWRSNQPAAIRLEQMWNDLIEGSELSLFCAYSTSHVYESFPEALRTPHSHIITSAMAESSGDAIVGHTVDRRIVYWNRGAERIYGYAPNEAIGQPSAMLMPPGQNELPAVIERIRRGEYVDHYETRRLRKDGTVIDQLACFFRVRSNDYPQTSRETKMSIRTKFALSAVIALSTAATASAAPKNQRIAVDRSGLHAQATVPRTAPLSNPYSPAATGGGSLGYNQSLLTWR